MSLTVTSNSYINSATNSQPQVQAQKTVCCWYYCTNTAASPQGLVNVVDLNGSVGYQLGLRDNLLCLWSFGANVLVSTPSIANAWTLAAYTWNGVQNRLTQNGTGAVTTATAGQTGTPAAVQTGGNTWNETFVGRIADARVYNRVLSDAELLTMYSLRGRDMILQGLTYRVSGMKDFANLCAADATIVGSAPSIFPDQFWEGRQ